MARCMELRRTWLEAVEKILQRRKDDERTTQVTCKERGGAHKKRKEEPKDKDPTKTRSNYDHGFTLPLV